MRDLERLQDARECEEKTIDALERILNRTEKSIDKLAQKVKNSEVVATVSGAVACVSSYLFASTDDFNVLVAKNGIDIFKTPEGMIMGGIAAAGFAIAGGALLYRAYQDSKIDEKLNNANNLEHQIADHQNNIEEIDSKILYSDGGEMALRRLSEETGVDYDRFRNAGREKDHEVKMDQPSESDNFAQGIQVIDLTQDK